MVVGGTFDCAGGKSVIGFRTPRYCGDVVREMDDDITVLGDGVAALGGVIACVEELGPALDEGRIIAGSMVFDVFGNGDNDLDL